MAATHPKVKVSLKGVPLLKIKVSLKVMGLPKATVSPKGYV